jgi:hypothetical protein
MGCDGPSKREHVIMVGKEEVRTRSCPRKLVMPAAPFVEAYKWMKSNRLHYLYPEFLPAKIGEAIDLIDATLSELSKNE